MKRCPICHSATDGNVVECRECGESFATWNTLETASEVVRQMGLRQAAAHDDVGATLSFFEAALANPLKHHAWLDAARGLVRLGRVEGALRLLEFTRRRAPDSGADALIDAIRQLLNADACEAAPAENNAAASPIAAANSGVPPQSMGRPPRRMLGLPPLPRKQPMLTRLAGGKSDQLWDAVLATEVQLQETLLNGTDWWERLAAHQPPHSAILYVLGLSNWQRHDCAGALPPFIQAVQYGAPVLNPIGYIICCMGNDATTWDNYRQLLLDLGIQDDEIRLVVQTLRRLQGEILPEEIAAGLKTVENQLNAV
jgi:hypothetical protein